MRLSKITIISLVLICFLWSCQKEYSLEGSNIKLPAGTWQFNDSSRLFRGNMDTAYIDSSGGTKTMNLMGTSLAGGEFFSMLLRTTDSFKIGTYTASLGASEFKYFNTIKNIYFSDQFTGEMVVSITAIGNNKVAGTFAGIAKDSSGNMKPITLGKFVSVIKLTAGSGGGGTATGTLGATAGACTSATPSGTYQQGVPLGASNTVQIQVNVSTIGTYTISTNTVNGSSFSKSGSFTTTGLQPVTLTGSGVPLNSGPQIYTVSFGSSTCTFSITYQAGALAATGTLGGTPGACTTATPAGTYTQGVPLTAANTISVQVTFLTPGAYNITTNTVNGVSFSKAGITLTTGVQTIALTGTGTPTSSGVQNFIVSFSGTTCTFSLTFASATVINNDYFPLTANSYWTYDDSFAAPDSTYKVNGTQGMLAGNTYRFMYYGTGPINSNTRDSTPYRKAGNDYFEYVSVDTFSTLTFDVPQHAELNFLKENSTNGTTYVTPEYVGTQGGVAVKVKYSFTITNTNTAITVNGVNYTNVIQVDWKSIEDPGTGYADAILFQTFFAKGIGMVKNTATDVPIGLAYSELLRNYQVY